MIKEMKGDKEKYLSFAGSRDDICIYNKPFWLDAVCGKNNWDAIVIEEKGEVAAAVPFHFKKRYGISGVLQPQLTQCFDILIRPLDELKRERALHYQFKWIGEIAKRLTEFGADFYDLRYSGRLNNGEAFNWEGFRQEVRYSFVIPQGQKIEEVLLQMDRATRAGIQKAAAHARLVQLYDIEQFYDIKNAAFMHKGMKNPNSKKVYERLYRACRANNACKMLAVKDEEGEICCAGLYVFDSSYVYELLVGIIPEKSSYNYKALMTYEMIKFACETGRGFDFEGSMVKGIAEHNRRFGAKQLQYYRFWKNRTKNPLKKIVLDRRSDRL